MAGKPHIGFNNVDYGRVVAQSNEVLGIIFKFALELFLEFAIGRRICAWVLSDKESR